VHLHPVLIDAGTVPLNNAAESGEDLRFCHFKCAASRANLTLKI
jgi:hypothetical protein